MCLDGHYKFDDLIFGEYTVSVELNQFDWCWESPILALSVTSEIATAPTFVHTGMKITVIASHDIQVTKFPISTFIPFPIFPNQTCHLREVLCRKACRSSRKQKIVWIALAKKYCFECLRMWKFLCFCILSMHESPFNLSLV